MSKNLKILYLMIICPNFENQNCGAEAETSNLNNYLNLKRYYSILLSPQKKYLTTGLFLKQHLNISSFGPDIWVRRGGLLAKHMGLKRGPIGNTLDEHIGNLMGT